MTVAEKAYAKINLFLDVTGKRQDGFHELVSVMHSVGLADEVEVTAERAEYSCITLEMVNSDLPADERNLAYLAAESFLSETGIEANVRVKLEKHIPVCAGLGGGSSDAAAVLRALNTIFEKPLSPTALCSLGATLGSDVPFCILGGTRLCKGRGERLESYPMDPLTVVLCTPHAEKMATAEAYRLLDEAFEDYREQNDALHEALFGFFAEDPILGMYNVFESVVLPRLPEADEIRAYFVEHGALGTLMSGSGSTVFALYEKEEEAEAVVRDLPGAVLCHSAPPHSL